MAGRPWIIVEHLEPVLGAWLAAEYSHLVDLAGAERVAFTNVPSCSELLDAVGRGVLCFQESVAELRGVLYRDYSSLLVLDPAAPRILDPREALFFDAVVVGGILGDHPPRGRTRELLTSRIRGVEARSLGPGQYSIDGAVAAYLLVEEGQHPYTLRRVEGVTIRFNYMGVTVEEELPYVYPVLGVEPEYPPELPWLLEKGLIYEEFTEVRGSGRPGRCRL